jgi:hypothetical protein
MSFRFVNPPNRERAPQHVFGMLQTYLCRVMFASRVAFFSAAAFGLQLRTIAPHSSRKWGLRILDEHFAGLTV